jgi:TrpR-related protein YerC/YecD
MDWKTSENRALLQAILSLASPDEAKRFLRDLMTENEIEEFSKRFQAAQMLSQNVPYSEIEKKTGLSSTTVARVSKWLNGKEGGYRKVIARLHHAPAVAGSGLR